MQRSRWFLLVPALAAAGALGAHLLAAAAFRRRVNRLAAGLDGAGGGEADPALPAIVQAFVRRAVGEGAAPGTVRLQQCAEVRAHPDAPWRRHTAEEIVGVHETGFVWLARLRLAPLLSLRILDAYVGGEGVIEARLFGSLRLSRTASPQVGRGELMRYLAELAWAPHAILHNPRLHWREIDADTVEVSADSEDGPARVRLSFENGDLARIEADDRPRAVGGVTIPTGWRGRFFDYREIGGCRIPTRAEASWLLDEGPFACWRGTVTAFAAEPA
ncbi:MAG TPA: DUF6544 family protein [Stellaceae bacterium]|nr:DUF6544 family protein [Stellaceae bacterium]